MLNAKRPVNPEKKHPFESGRMIRLKGRKKRKENRQHKRGLLEQRM